MKNYSLLFLISLCFLFACKDSSKRTESEISKTDTAVQKPADPSINEDRLQLDSIAPAQITINDLPLQLDTASAIKILGKTYSRDVYARGMCYYFGDANLWDFNGARYYIYKDSLYFHELYFDGNYKDQNFTIALPKLTVSRGTGKSDFQKAYPVSFTNSEQPLSNSILFRMGNPWQCFLRFDFKEDKLWRVAIGM